MRLKCQLVEVQMLELHPSPQEPQRCCPEDALWWGGGERRRRGSLLLQHKWQQISFSNNWGTGKAQSLSWVTGASWFWEGGTSPTDSIGVGCQKGTSPIGVGAGAPLCIPYQSPMPLNLFGPHMLDLAAEQPYAPNLVPCTWFNCSDPCTPAWPHIPDPTMQQLHVPDVTAKQTVTQLMLPVLPHQQISRPMGSPWPCGLELAWRLEVEYYWCIYTLAFCLPFKLPLHIEHRIPLSFPQ